MSTPDSPSSEPPTTATATATATATSTTTTWWESHAKARTAIDSLSQLLGPLTESLSSSDTPAHLLLHNVDVGAGVIALLRRPSSGAGDDNLCRWLYDTFHTSDPDLQLVVLRFVPTLCGVYLMRSLARKPLAGFEAVLLAIYAHETKARADHPLAVRVPDLSHPSLYHEATKTITTNNAATPVHIAVVSPALEPHGTVRATNRARIVSVALDLYHSNISLMPTQSKVEFCQVCIAWAGQDGDMYKTMGPDGLSNQILDNSLSSKPDDYEEKKTELVKEENIVKRGRRIPLPWELLQPCLRILSHCLLGPGGPIDLKEAAHAAIRSLYARALHDMNTRAILATGSLLRLQWKEPDYISEIDSRGSTDYPGSAHIVFTATTSGRSSA